MVWTGQTFTVGQVLSAANMNNLQADITALANDDTGAPEIVRTALKSTTASGSGTGPGSGYTYITLNPYPFFPMLYGANAGIPHALFTHSTNGTADQPRFGMSVPSGASYGYAYRYLAA